METLGYILLCIGLLVVLDFTTIGIIPMLVMLSNERKKESDKAPPSNKRALLLLIAVLATVGALILSMK